MAQPPDYYDVLGVDPSATAAEITRAWRRLVLLVRHPSAPCPPLTETDKGRATPTKGAAAMRSPLTSSS